MVALTLMDRAKAVLQRRTAAAALVIVPLAMAVPGRADSVSFDTPSASINSTSGGDWGHASATGSPTS